GIGTLTSGATTTTVTLTGGDGIRTVYYQVVDVVRWNSGTITDSIILDTTLPVTILKQITSVQVKNDIIIIGTATDIPIQIVRVEYYIDSGSWIQAEPNDGKFDSGTEAFSIILVDLAEGTHTITACAIDAAGNIGPSTSTTFLVDTQGPMLSNIQITPQITNKSPVITGTVTDLYNAPVLVNFYLDTYYGTNTPVWGTMTILSPERLQSDITGTINLSGLEEGEHTVYIQSMDLVGNWGDVAISKFIYSQTGLIVEITQAPSEFTNQSTVSISGLAYNITGVKIIEIRCMLDDKNIGTYTYDTIVAKYVFGTVTGFVDGTHTISIIAKDAALNRATVTTKFFVDRTKPTIGTINVIYPTGQTRVKEGDVVTIKVEVTETGTASGISQVLLDASNIGGEANQVMSHNGDIYTAQVTLSDTSPNIEIERLITIKATDRANNYNEDTQTVFIDNKAPVFYSLDSNKDIYKDGETIILTIKLDSGSYTLRADFSDIDSTYQVGSETGEYKDGTYTITYTISLQNTIRDGKYSIPIFATDQANNITERHISIDLNNLATGVFTAQPDEVKNGDTIIFIYTLPQNGSFTACIINLFNLDSTVSGTVTMSDMGNGIYKLIHLISLANTCTSGTKIIHANIYDTKGNLFGSDTVAVVLDNQPPEVLGTISQNIRPKPVEKNGRLEIYVAEIEIFGSITGEARLVWWKSGNIISNKVIMVDRGFYFNHIPVEIGTNPVTIFVEDEIGNVGSQTVILYRIEGKVSESVGAAGGVVENPDGTKVEIPSNALLVVVNITINTLPAEIEAEKKPVNDNIQLLGIPHEFGPSGIVFYQPVKMVFVYTDVDLERFAAKVGRPIDESELKIFFWDEERHDWIKVGGVVDANNNTIWVYVNHFTIYDLGIDTAPPPTQPAVYINRNPFKFGEVTEFMADLPDNVSKVTVRIFDLSGDLVRVITEDQSLSDKKGQANVNLGSWDGMNDFGNYVGSGIYVYQVIITFTDGSTYVKTKPIGVIK
ncbi:MAG: Ig-like domain-containing protein, partial [bacterium]